MGKKKKEIRCPFCKRPLQDLGIKKGDDVLLVCSFCGNIEWVSAKKK